MASMLHTCDRTYTLTCRSGMSSMLHTCDRNYTFTCHNDMSSILHTCDRNYTVTCQSDMTSMLHSRGRNYTVTCQSSMASTLTAVVADMTGGFNATMLIHTFTEADGVQAGTDYSCDVTLTAGSHTSGHSPTAFVTTINVAGMLTIIGVHHTHTSLH